MQRGRTRSANVFDSAVSSYTPTLGSLINARNRERRYSHTHLQALVAGVPNPYKGSPLPGVYSELEVIQAVVDRTNSNLHAHNQKMMVNQTMMHANAEGILHALPSVAILHLACHGEQDSRDALNSGFEMRDRRLSIADLLHLDLKGALLAFLSACETAKGDEIQPDQSIHLAAAMLFAGFSNVIGTMWFVTSF